MRKKKFLKISEIGIRKYGFFDDKNNEFVIRTPSTPRSWENRIWNEQFNLQITNHGKGIAYTKNNRDKFVLFNYKCPNRYIYIFDNLTKKLWSPTYYPTNEELDFYEVRHGLKYSIFNARKDNIETEWTVTAHYNDCAELWHLKIKNNSRKKRKLTIIPFYQIDLTLKDPYFGEVNLYKSFISNRKNILYIKNCSFIRRGEDDALAINSNSNFEAFEMYTGSFLRSFSSLSAPHTIIKNDWKNSLIDDENEPCFALKISLILKPLETYQTEFQIFTATNLSTAEKMAEKYKKEDAFKKSMQFHKDYAKTLSKINNIYTEQKIFNRYANIWIKHQTYYNAEWNRGWGIGFRDSMSDCDIFRTFNPELVRKRIIQAAEHIYEDGHTVRSFFPPIEKPYFDGGIWFQNTLCQYIQETGDWSILEEKVSYFKSEKSDNILQHAKKTIKFLDEQRGPDGICRMGFGDWNDALNGIDREGKGESIWTTIAYIFGLKNMAKLLKKIGDKEHLIYSEREEELSEILNRKFFEQDHYVRAVTDKGRLIGSNKNKEGKIYLEPQGWALFTGIADKEKAKKILTAVRRELYVPYGVLLLAPAYTKYYEDIGRITNDSPGLVENGSNYVHASLFFAYGLARAGFPDESFEILCRLLPSNPENPPEKSFLEPFQITNSYRGPDAKNPGRAMFAWRTGSAAWFLKTIWDGLLGIKPDFDELEIDARIPHAFGNEFSAEKTIRGKNIKFFFSRKNTFKNLKNSIITTNSSKLPYDKIKNINSIIVKF